MMNVQTVLLFAIKLSGFLLRELKKTVTVNLLKKVKKKIHYNMTYTNISYFKGLIDFQNKTFW